ncbi:hypothetical protein AGDE_12977 [Angomonas deanei]|uniref:Uncharacterized protein n=1 Tax=Angomonas deanei TaxID=59799 RepID=A0A7G2C9T5_9TRYP|nr:hypothetical protein AGDE_12977 [Angomonas deanei]CAD2216620.1 hypothetical protein, conserved [Angomonas deanei]|eukprot:EPY23191.1 hypothetical protein AGDE_12977 [Angomonas deanei]
MDRLTAPNTVMRLRKTEKYEKRIEREKEEEAARRRRRPLSPNPVALDASKRLYLQAKALQNNLASQQKLQAEKAEEEEEEFTFQPTLSSYSKRITEEGYIPLEDRVDDGRERRERLKLEKEAAIVQELKFKPTLSPGSRQIVAERGRCSTDVGERLYAEGGERLLRGQVRQRREEKKATGMTVGPRQISRAQLEQLTTRMKEWQERREARQEELRSETGQQQQQRYSRQTSVASGQTRGNSETSRNTNLNKPRRSPSAPVAQGKAAAAPTSRKTRSPANGSDAVRAAKPLTRSASAGTTSNPHRYCTENRSLSRSPSATHVDPTSTAQYDLLKNPLYREMREIRFGALFYKYAAPHHNAVTLRHIKEQVKRYYPEDSGVVVALRERLLKKRRNRPPPTVNEHDQDAHIESLLLEKSVFVSLLVEYESLHGAQSWGRTEKDNLLFPLRDATPAAVGPNPAANDHEKHNQSQVSQASSGRRVVVSTPNVVYAGPSDFQRFKALTSKIQRGDAAAPNIQFVVEQPKLNAKEMTEKVLSAKKPSGKSGSSGVESSSVEPKPKKSTPAPNKRSTSTGKKEHGYAQPRKTAPKEDETAQYPFRPNLGQRTIELSQVNELKRQTYLKEKELRKKELKIILDDKTPQAAVKETKAERTPYTTPVKPPNDLPSDTKRSPSIELSSLSSNEYPSVLQAMPNRSPKLTGGSMTATTAHPCGRAASNSKDPQQYTDLREVEAELKEMDLLFDALYRKAHAL